MSEKTQYFRKFPLVNYNGTPAINIMRRVDFNANIKNFLTTFYSFTVKAETKFENIAFEYYDDVDYDWLVYHCNDIIDPYFDTPLEEEDFENHIVNKYGSLRTALRKTKYYVSNYNGDDSTLSTSGYDALPASSKKYWNAARGFNNKIVSYVRSTDDFKASTNMNVSFNLAASSGTFNAGEIVSIDGNSTATATVSWANTTAMNIIHVEGDFSNQSANTNYSITGDETGVTATVDISSYKVINYVIPESELVYYKRKTCYDYELDINNKKRTIDLIDANYAGKLNKQLDKIMGEG